MSLHSTYQAYNWVDGRPKARRDRALGFDPRLSTEDKSHFDISREKNRPKKRKGSRWNISDWTSSSSSLRRPLKSHHTPLSRTASSSSSSSRCPAFSSWKRVCAQSPSSAAKRAEEEKRWGPATTGYKKTERWSELVSSYISLSAPDNRSR